jgi:hypothetical protein
MAKQTINVGAAPNDGTGDTLRDSFVKTNDNFTDVYDNKQDTLVSATNIKTVNGSSILGSGNLVVGGSSGIFGISNSSGVYTYYATLTLAMTAATSGQVIEMFANYTETGAVAITLKDGVNINGNGYTYTLNNNGLLSAFICPTTAGVKISILNLIAVRTGSTGINTDNAVIFSATTLTGLVNCSGSTFRNTGSGSCIASISGVEFTNATCIANTDKGSIACYSSYSKFTNCIGYSTSGVGMSAGSGTFINCYGYSDSSIGMNAGAGSYLNNCLGVSSSGNGMQSLGNVMNSTGRSTTGTGLLINTTAIATNCSGFSVSGIGIYSGALGYNCVGISSSSYGMEFVVAKMYNCSAKSTSNAAIYASTGNSQLYNHVIITDWNNASGYGIRANGTPSMPSILSNCTFILANATAPYLFSVSGAAASLSMRGNTYKGGAAFNVNITQAITNTEDNQGNIYL